MTNISEGIDFPQLKRDIEKAGLTILQFEVNEPVDKEIISKIESSLGISIPDHLKQFYSKHNGINIHWKSLEEKTLRGWIDIWPIEKIFSGQNGSAESPVEPDGLYEFLWFDDHADEELEFRKSLGIIEPHLGMSTATAIQIKKTGEYSLFISDIDKLVKIPLSFNEYLKVISITFGLPGVRFQLQNDDFYSNPKGKYQTLELLEKLDMLDISKLYFLKNKKTEIIYGN